MQTVRASRIWFCSGRPVNFKIIQSTVQTVRVSRLWFCFLWLWFNWSGILVLIWNINFRPGLLLQIPRKILDMLFSIFFVCVCVWNCHNNTLPALTCSMSSTETEVFLVSLLLNWNRFHGVKLRQGAFLNISFEPQLTESPNLDNLWI